VIEKINLDKTNAWPFVEAKKILRERKNFIEKKR
jgi:lysyl-tRNA synthetase class 1